MKTMRTLIIAILLCISSSSLFSQTRQAFLHAFDTLTLPQVKKMLKEQSKEIDQLIKLSGMQISISTKANGSEIEKFQKAVIIKPGDSLKKEVFDYLNNIELTQKLFGSFSLVHINNYDYSSIKEIMYGQETAETTLKINNIYFTDGTIMKLDTDYSTHEFELPTGKFMDSISCELTYRLPSKPLIIELTKDNTDWTENGEFASLKQMVDGSFSLVTSDSLQKRIFMVEAINKNGKALQQNSSSTYSAPSENNLETLKKISALCKKLILNITNNKYKATLQLKQEIEASLISIPEWQNGQQSVSSNYSVSGTPLTIRIFAGSGNTKVIENVVLKNLSSIKYKAQWYIEKNTGPLYIAMDTSVMLYGFTNAQGKWKIPAGFVNIVLKEKNYYEVYLNADNLNNRVLYKLDTLANTFTRCNFSNISQLTPGLLKTENNNRYGVIDVNGRQVLPIKFKEIEFSNKVLIVANGPNINGSWIYSAYDVDGNQLLKPAFYNIEVKGNFIYGSLVDSSFYDKVRTGVYNLKGKSVISSDYSGEGFYGIDSLLLAFDKKRNAVYLNTKGDVAFGTMPLDRLERFSNGMAVVMNNKGLYGYINTKGILVIPCIYTQAYPFQTNYGMVYLDKNGNGYNYYFIERSNTIFKEISGKLKLESWEVDGDGYIIDGVKYDGDGKAKNTSN